MAKNTNTARKSDTTPTAAVADYTLPRTGSNPTAEQFSAYQAAFDYFNRTLFAGQLAPVILNFSRKAKSLGFFAAERWGKQEGEDGRAKRHEISLNPSYLAMRPARETMSTLVHEMCHLWQQDHGTPPRGGYHNREWGSKMESVGLMPSNTGLPGGKKTGDRMTHYIVEGGAFAKAFESIPAEYLLPWSAADFEEEKAKRPASKVKFTCPGCMANAWGKPNLRITCGSCEQPMISAADADGEDGES